MCNHKCCTAVQPTPIRKTARSTLSAATQLFLLISGRSLRGLSVRQIHASMICRPNKPLAELLYDDTHHPAIAVVDNLLHGFLEFDLTLLVYHGYLACNAVIY